CSTDSVSSEAGDVVWKASDDQCVKHDGKRCSYRYSSNLRIQLHELCLGLVRGRRHFDRSFALFLRRSLDLPTEPQKVAGACYIRTLLWNKRAALQSL